MVYEVQVHETLFAPGVLLRLFPSIPKKDFPALDIGDAPHPLYYPGIKGTLFFFAREPMILRGGSKERKAALHPKKRLMRLR